MNTEETWKDVVGYEEYFMVSNLGNVFGKRSGRILKPTKSPSGYLTINNKIGGRKGKNISIRVHRMVADAFLPKPSEEMIANCINKGYGLVLVNHKDFNKINNNVDNLEWCTYAQNAQHAANGGRVPKTLGESQPMSKLTDDDVRYIRCKYTPRDKEYGARALARKFCVSHERIVNIIKRKSWAHVQDE